MMDIIARGQTMSAAVLRGASADEIEYLRMAGMAAAEAYFDRTLETARVVRAMIEDHPDKDHLGEEGAKRLLR